MKHYKFQFVRSSEKEFLQLPKPVRQKIQKKMEVFMKSENPLYLAKKLKGYRDVFRFRIGDYRLLVRPKNKQEFVILLIVKVGHRRAIYKELD